VDQVEDSQGLRKHLGKLHGSRQVLLSLFIEISNASLNNGNGLVHSKNNTLDSTVLRGQVDNLLLSTVSYKFSQIAGLQDTMAEGIPEKSTNVVIASTAAWYWPRKRKAEYMWRLSLMISIDSGTTPSASSVFYF
jgi:hypothetical protein